MNQTKITVEEFCAQFSNSSCFGRGSLTAVDVLMYLSVAAIVLLTVCGNLLVIMSICHFKQLHTPTNLLLLSLAVTDLLVGVTVMPFYFSYLTEAHWCFGEICCIIYNVATCYLINVSCYNVACIAVDRYFALSNPFLYSNNITVNLILKIISMLWLSLFMYTFTLLYVNGNFTDIKGTTVCATQCLLKISEIWAVIDFTTAFVVPCLIIIIMYLKIFFIAKKHANAIQCLREQHHSKSTGKNNYSLASETKAAKKIGILVSVFLLCVLPYYISLFLTFIYIRNILEKYRNIFFSVQYTQSLLYINSSLNPILHALFYSWFQKCVKHIITFRICSFESSLINVFSKDTFQCPQ